VDTAIQRQWLNISENDFWSSIRLRKGDKHAGVLREAVAPGMGRKKAKAYAALGDYLQAVLRDEWDIFRSKAKAPDPRKLEDLYNNKITSWYQTYQFDGEIDFNTKDLLEFSGFHYLGWMEPAIAQLICVPDDERARAWLIRTMTRYYGMRNRIRKAGDTHVLFDMLGMSGRHETFLRIYLALLHSGGVPTALAEGLLKLILGQGRALHHVLERFFVHNIHTAACFGQFILSRRMRMFAESVQWERRSLGHLVKHTDRSFFPDGGHLERCWGYGMHTLWRMIQVYHFARRTGGMGRREAYYLRNLRRACRWYAKTTAFGERRPGYGDDGVGRASEIVDHALTIFPKGTDRSLGVDRTKSYLMDTSRFAILRNGDSKDSVYLTLTYGDYAGWHSHFDSLSLNLWRGDQPILQEQSRFDSYGAPLDHTFRAPDAHNAVLVDGWPYDSRFDDGCMDVAWYSDERVDYFSAYHRAYREQPAHMHRTYVASGDAIVRRTVLFVKDPGYAVVLDCVQGEPGPAFNRAISGIWHATAPFTKLGPDLVRTRGRNACLLAWAYPDGIHRTETMVDYTREESGGNNERYRLRVRRWEPFGYQGCLGFVTLLYPFVGRMPKASIRPLKTTGGQRFRTEALDVLTPAGRDVIILNPERLEGFAVRGRNVEDRASVRLGRRRGQSVVN